MLWQAGAAKSAGSLREAGQLFDYVKVISPRPSILISGEIEPPVGHAEQFGQAQGSCGDQGEGAGFLPFQPRITPTGQWARGA